MVIKLLCALQASIDRSLVEVVFDCKSAHTKTYLILFWGSSPLCKINSAHRLCALLISQGQESHHIKNSEQLKSLLLASANTSYPIICLECPKPFFIEPEPCIFSECDRRVIASHRRRNCVFFVHSISVFSFNATQNFLRRISLIFSLCIRSFCRSSRLVLSHRTHKEASSYMIDFFPLALYATQNPWR